MTAKLVEIDSSRLNGAQVERKILDLFLVMSTHQGEYASND